ncbi:MAG TPA: hypothetical protein VIV63_03920 [Steroidobacteraceae bacterium]
MAKIYHEAPDPNKVSKLAVMARLAPAELLRIAAWPIDLLNDEHGATRGFLMRRVSSREDAHELYSPKSRRRAFPDADFRFVVHAAANVARAFAQMHSLGHVIGDVNHGNALIGRDATVMLIDCDSFQVKDGESNFTCDVGVPLFTPPELQGQTFRGLERKAEHDAFGLAVLLFHLLFAGRHPYAGSYADGEMPIERAIAESRFAYGSDAVARGMSAPPATLPLTAFGAPVAALFERAFAGPAVSRPTAVEWVEALTLVESTLTNCVAASVHQHPRGLSCCWCELESRSSVAMFGRTARTASPIFDAGELKRLWQVIADEIVPPASKILRELYIEVARARAADIKGGRRAIVLFVYVLVALMVASGLTSKLGVTWITLTTIGGFVLHRWLKRTEGDSAKLQKELIQEMETLVSSESYNQVMTSLEKARRRLLKIQKDPASVMSGVAATHELARREQILDSIPLTAEGAPALNSGERAALASSGVETVADVLAERSQLHHALRYAQVRDLIQWAEARANELQLDPGVTAELKRQSAVEQALRAEANALLGELREGPHRLKHARDEILKARAQAELALTQGRHRQ